MPQVLTDADIDKLSGKPPLTDADIAAHESKPAIPSMPSPQDTAHKDFLDFKAAHPNIKESDIQERATGPDPELHDINAFKENHPYIYGTLHALFNDATPAPGIMAVEGPLGAAVQSATKAGGQTAGQFVDAVLQHPKTIAAMKDAAMEWLYSIPAVKAIAKTAKGVSTIKDVIDDVRGAQAVSEVPMAAPAASPGTPVRPPLAPKPAVVDISEQVAPKEAPPSDLTQKLNELLRKVKIEGGFDPDRPLGEVKGGRYPNRFAGDDSPIINSAEQRTSGSNLPVANPGMVAKNIADKISDKVSVEMFDKIMKNPNGVRVLGALQQEGYVPDTEVIAMIRRRLMKRTNISNEMMNKVGK